MEIQKNEWSARIKKNTITLGYWTAAWTLSMAVATFGPLLVWDNIILTVFSIFLNLGLGIGMIQANIRYIKSLDEMQQKIQLEAMSLTLGISVIAGLGYSLLETSGIIHFHAEISHLVILIGLTYLAGIVIGGFRYK